LANYQLDPATMRMQPVGQDKAKGSREKDVGWYIGGDTLQTLLRYAKEDGLDMSTPTRRGQAVTSYAKAGVQLLIDRREATQPPTIEATGQVVDGATQPGRKRNS